MKKNIETTELINVTITNIVEGDTSEKFTEEYKRGLARKIRSELDVDDVSVDSVKTFVMEKSDHSACNPTDYSEIASILVNMWSQAYQEFLDKGFDKGDASRLATSLMRTVIEVGTSK